MNHLQLLAFVIYGFSVLIVGASIYKFINKSGESFLNRSVYLGEVFLLGSIFIIGELLILSLVGLYKAPCLWAVVGLNYLLLLRPETRKEIAARLLTGNIFSFPVVIFLALLSVFIFRNYYFLVTGDSHNVYLFAQKLWLMKGTSILGDAGNNIAIFTPHFNAVPYGLGLSLFGQEVLFPQLIDISWRVVVLLLVFGYASYRLNRYFGLIAVLLVLFDEHFFYSGVNACVIINGAVTAFLFACACNFWESREQNSPFRFLLALIFLSQLMANKYQLAIVTFLMIIMGLSVQPAILDKIKNILQCKRAVMALFAAIFITGLWYIKNFLATGCPTFPILADKFGVFNWTPEMTHNFSKVFGGLNAGLFFKYLSYSYVWSGVMPLKILALVMAGLPFIFLIAALRSKIEKDAVAPLCFWLGVSFLAVAGFCFVTFSDPRIYRYALPVFAYSTVFSMTYVLQYCVGIKREFILGIGSVILFFLVFGLTLATRKIIPCKVATVSDNIGVLFNRIHMKEAILKYYPQNIMALREFDRHKEKVSEAAWDVGPGGANPFSAFLLPVRPQVGVWCTTLIKWKSFEDERSVIRDLNEAGIKWVMTADGDSLKFLTSAEFAERVVKLNRYPKESFYNYGFPSELSQIQW